MFEKIENRKNNISEEVIDNDIFSLKDAVISGDISLKKAFEYLNDNADRLSEIKEQFKTLPKNPEVSKRVVEDKQALVDNMRNVYSEMSKKSKTLWGKMFYKNKESDFKKVGAFILHLEKEL